MSLRTFLRGYHYRSPWFYHAADLFKRGTGVNARFCIAQQYIDSNDSVLDVCAGAGRLRDFISPGCRYAALEASPEFRRALARQGVDCIFCDLHQGLPADIGRYDVVVMVIALAQFRKTSVDQLLEVFKAMASRVVIVEEVLSAPRPEQSWFQKIVNHLCATDYYVPVSWYTHQDFEALMQRHGYQHARRGAHHMVGIYEVRS